MVRKLKRSLQVNDGSDAEKPKNDDLSTLPRPELIQAFRDRHEQPAQPGRIYSMDTDDWKECGKLMGVLCEQLKLRLGSHQIHRQWVDLDDVHV